MTDDQQFIWINTNRRGNCQTCSSPIQVGERALWDKPNKRIWCSPCAVKNGFVDNNKEGKGKEEGQKGTSSSSTTTTSVTPSYVRCPFCWTYVPDHDMHTVFVAAHEPQRICSFCQRMATAQYWLKIAGLWTRPKNTEADKP